MWKVVSRVYFVRCIHIPFCKCEHEDRNVIVNISRVNVEKYLLAGFRWTSHESEFRMWRSAQVRRLLDSSEALKYAYSWIDCNINTRRIFLLGIKISRKFCFFSLSEMYFLRNRNIGKFGTGKYNWDESGKTFSRFLCIKEI